MQTTQAVVSSRYYVDPFLKNNLVEIRNSLEKKDKDYVMIVDGLEGSGKSTFAMQIGCYIEPDLLLDRIVFDAKTFREAVLSAQKNQVVIFDEAFRGLSSRATLSEVNRTIVQLMMEMRQKNLFVIIVQPSIFLLDKYVALFRAKCLAHVYESSGNRGYYSVFNQQRKKYLYLKGSKYYNYQGSRPNFSGRFYGKFPLLHNTEEEYREKKKQAFMESDQQQDDKKTLLKKVIISLLLKNVSENYQECLVELNKHNYTIPESTFYKFRAQIKGN